MNDTLLAKFRATDGPVSLTHEEAQQVRLQAVREENAAKMYLNRKMRRLLARKAGRN